MAFVASILFRSPGNYKILGTEVSFEKDPAQNFGERIKNMSGILKWFQ